MNIIDKKSSYKLSRFIRVYPHEDFIYIYNSLNGFKAKIFDEYLIEQITKMQKGIFIDKIDERLINSGICVKDSIDEGVVATSYITSNLIENYSSLRLIILPTRECNFRCVYCYEEKRKEY